MQLLGPSLQDQMESSPANKIELDCLSKIVEQMVLDLSGQFIKNDSFQRVHS